MPRRVLTTGRLPPVAPAARHRCATADRVRTPVDRFIAEVAREAGAFPRPRCRSRNVDPPPQLRPDRRCRRGPEEIAAFLDDADPDAYDRLVERLLASPRYGERWGKYWLDASGYADSNGYFDADTDRPLAYRYRDYVIRAFNADRPLDQIVREQLAGDELAGDRRGRERHAGDRSTCWSRPTSLRNGQDGTGESDGNPDEVRVDQYAVLEGAIQIIGSSLLGLTFQCAKCHDHKFEPITPERVLPAPGDPLSGLQRRALGQAQRPSGDRRAARRAGALGGARQGDRCRDRGVEADVRPGQTREGEEKTLKPVIDAANARRRTNPGRIAWVGDVSGDPSEIPILLRGNPATPGPKVGPGVPAFLTDADNRYEPKPPLRARRDRPAARPGAVAHEARLAPGGAPGACAGQPDLAAPFRHRAGRHVRQPRLHRLAAHRIPSCSSSWPASWRDRAGAPRRCTA